MKKANTFCFILFLKELDVLIFQVFFEHKWWYKIEPEILNWKSLSNVRIADKTVMIPSAKPNWGMSLRRNLNFKAFTWRGCYMSSLINL